uniref:Uncharacterized protein n=1 Tax=Knipowitschia caucasica TaxID=637954 RepID=A0AAV2KP75_KNICA
MCAYGCLNRTGVVVSKSKVSGCLCQRVVSLGFVWSPWGGTKCSFEVTEVMADGPIFSVGVWRQCLYHYNQALVRPHLRLSLWRNPCNWAEHGLHQRSANNDAARRVSVCPKGHARQ